MKDLRKTFEGWNKVRVKRTTSVSVDLFPKQHRGLVEPYRSSPTPLFSLGFEVLAPKRPAQTGDNFEKLVLVTGNMHLLKGNWLCRREKDEKNENDWPMTVMRLL